MSHTPPPYLSPTPSDQIVIYIGVFYLWVSFTLSWISWVISIWSGKLTNLIKQGPISYSEQLF